MTESWVIMHTGMKSFVRFPPRWDNGKAKASWTIHLNKARCFPSERAALAVQSEWGLKDISRVAVVCPSED